MYDRAAAIDLAFRERVMRGDLPAAPPVPAGPLLPGAGPAPELTARQLADLFESQVMSRHLDFMARETKGKTFYSIGSSGHEAMAAVAEASRLSDMAFLHYRDAGFLIQRKKMLGGQTVLWDMCLSFAAAAEDPVSGGRHKVLGGKEVFVPPQTSTIASHLPKAVGAAHGVGMAARLPSTERELPPDAVILCSFGDASANHSTAQGAFNAAAWAAYQHSPMPIVFICEDNGIGISVPTPQGWIAANFAQRPGLKYLQAEGCDLGSVYAAAHGAIQFARARRRPVFLHLSMVRLMGHAGADIEAVYTKQERIAQTEARDPLLVTARRLLDRGVMGRDEILDLYNGMGARVRRVAEAACARPRLSSAEEIAKPLIPAPIQVQPAPSDADTPQADDKPLPLAKHITLALAEALATRPETVIFGEDVARKGGVYGVTSGLLQAFGPARVMDTLLDEQTILGLGIGLSQTGLLPIPEIQFLAYVHNAADQIRGEAATLPFFSNGHYSNPMVIRIAGLAYQKGFGGHFHNDNSLTAFRDIPGVIVACPSNGPDGAAMLRTCLDLAARERRVVLFIEPIALYQAADLHETGDKGWAAPYQPAGKAPEVAFGAEGQTGAGTDLCLLTYGNGAYLSVKAQKLLAEKGIAARVVDLRWLQPLNTEAVLRHGDACDRMLIVDECRRTGSLSEQIMTALMEAGHAKPVARLTAEDCFIPLGPAAYEILPSAERIAAAAEALCAQARPQHQTAPAAAE